MANNNPTMNRRRFLTTAAFTGFGLALGGTGIVSACSNSEAKETDPMLSLVTLGPTDRVLVAGRPQRITFGIVGGDDRETITDQDSLEVVIRQNETVIDEMTVTGHIVNHDHVAGTGEDHQHSKLQRYYALQTTLPTPGIYDIEATVRNRRASGPIQAFDPAQAVVPLVGDPFTAPRTPTVEDPAGVDRLCTRFEPCPFHTESAADITAAGRPLVLLVATPAFCQTAYCGPVLDALMDAVADLDDPETLGVVHAEVYANADEVDGDYNNPAIRLAPAVKDLGLTFEPCLFVVDTGGMLVARLDNVFDRSELDTALQTVL